MRVVDRKTFLALPSGTLFQKINPKHLGSGGSVDIKNNTMEPNDFCSQPTNPVDTDEIFAMISEGETLSVDFDSGYRDGMFDDDQLFLVWDRADHEGLIELFQEAFDSAYGKPE